MSTKTETATAVDENSAVENPGQALQNMGGVGGHAPMPRQRDGESRAPRKNSGSRDGQNPFGEARRAVRAVTSRHPTDSEINYVSGALEALENDHSRISVLRLLAEEVMEGKADMQALFNTARILKLTSLAHLFATLKKAVDADNLTLTELAEVGILDVWEKGNGEQGSRHQARSENFRNAIPKLRALGKEKSADVLESSLKQKEIWHRGRAKDSELRSIIAKRKEVEEPSSKPEGGTKSLMKKIGDEKRDAVKELLAEKLGDARLPVDEYNALLRKCVEEVLGEKIDDESLDSENQRRRTAQLWSKVNTYAQHVARMQESVVDKTTDDAVIADEASSEVPAKVADETTTVAVEETSVPLAEMDVPALQKIVKAEEIKTAAKTQAGLVSAIEAHRAKKEKASA